MTKVRIAFDKLDGITTDEMRKGKIKPGYEHANVHMIFDIKMDGKFTIKEILHQLFTKVLCPGRVLGLHFYLNH